jgi:hypothetical protein
VLAVRAFYFGGMKIITFVRQEFAGQDHTHAVSFRIGFPRDVHAEVDCAHDAVAEFLMDQFLDGRSIYIQISCQR